MALAHMWFHREYGSPPPHSGINVPENTSLSLIKTPKSRCFLLRTA